MAAIPVRIESKDISHTIRLNVVTYGRPRLLATTYLNRCLPGTAASGGACCNKGRHTVMPCCINLIFEGRRRAVIDPNDFSVDSSLRAGRRCLEGPGRTTIS